MSRSTRGGRLARPGPRPWACQRGPQDGMREVERHSPEGRAARAIVCLPTAPSGHCARPRCGGPAGQFASPPAIVRSRWGQGSPAAMGRTAKPPVACVVGARRLFPGHGDLGARQSAGSPSCGWTLRVAAFAATSMGLAPSEGTTPSCPLAGRVLALACCPHWRSRHSRGGKPGRGPFGCRGVIALPPRPQALTVLLTTWTETPHGGHGGVLHRAMDAVLAEGALHVVLVAVGAAPGVPVARTRRRSAPMGNPQTRLIPCMTAGPIRFDKPRPFRLARR